MEHVKEGWEDLAHPTSRYHVWECILEQQLLHRWPQVMPHMPGGQGQHRSNTFSKSFISAPSPKMSQCHSVYYFHHIRNDYLSAISTAVDTEKKFVCLPNCEVVALCSSSTGQHGN